MAIHIQQCLGVCAAHRGTGRNQTPLALFNRLTGQDLVHELLNLTGDGQLRQRAHAARQVGIRRDRNAERTEALVTGVKEKVQHSQTWRLVEEADDPFSPAVWARVVHRANGRLFLRGEKLAPDQGHVLAEREA